MAYTESPSAHCSLTNTYATNNVQRFRYRTLTYAQITFKILYSFNLTIEQKLWFL